MYLIIKSSIIFDKYLIFGISTTCIIVHIREDMRILFILFKRLRFKVVYLKK